MKSKWLIGFLIGMMFILPIAFAAEVQPTTLPIEPIVETNLEDIETLPDPGLTPDNPLYGAELVVEKIQLALTVNKVKKAELSLKFADERLAEIDRMVELEKPEKAIVAQREHERNMEQVEAQIGEIDEANATEEMGEIVAIRERVNLHQMNVERIGESLLKIKGNLTEEQQNMITTMMATMEQTTLRLKVEVQNKETSSKVKIKLQTGQSDAEVDELIGQLQEQYQLEQRGKSGIYDSNQKTDKTTNGAGSGDVENDSDVDDGNETDDGNDTDTSNGSHGNSNNAGGNNQAS